MADFCTKCAANMFGSEIEPDYNIEKIAETLKPGYWKPVLCEGCGMNAVIKQDDGSVTLSFFNLEDHDADYIETPLTEWLEKPAT